MGDLNNSIITNPQAILLGGIVALGLGTFGIWPTYINSTKNSVRIADKVVAKVLLKGSGFVLETIASHSNPKDLNGNFVGYPNYFYDLGRLGLSQQR